MAGNPVVIEARRWIGTPYRHQHSMIGVGCDCLGLVRGVWRELYGDEPEAIPNYSPGWGEVAREEVLIRAAHRHLTPTTILSPGTVLVFRMRRNRIAKHCGIATGEGTFVHSYQGSNGVVETPLVDYWLKKVAAMCDYPGGM